MAWEDEQKWEKDWWGNCINSYGEQTKQRSYAPLMGLEELGDARYAFYYDLDGASVLDIGCGPVSLLLKCINFSRAVAIDPVDLPVYVKERYKAADIEYYQLKGEDLDIADPEKFDAFDEVWIYNVLQHVDDPGKIVQNARRISKIVRVFEWLEIGKAPGHPHNLLEPQMNEWFGGEGKVNANVPRGKEYYGIFLGDKYEGYTK
jgi:SAM-dependent methyltransferase